MFPEELLPHPTKASRPFWDGCHAGELRLQQCDHCQTYVFYPAYCCTACGADTLTWRQVSGRGRIYSVTHVHRPSHPALGVEGPYALALIELEEGPIMMSNVVGAAPEEVTIGRPVEVGFRRVSAEISLPVFSLV